MAQNPQASSIPYKQAMKHARCKPKIEVQPPDSVGKKNNTGVAMHANHPRYGEAETGTWLLRNTL